MIRLLAIVLILLPSVALAQVYVVQPMQPVVMHQPAYEYTPIFQYDIKGPLGIVTWHRLYIIPVKAVPTKKPTASVDTDTITDVELPE